MEFNWKLIGERNINLVSKVKYIWQEINEETQDPIWHLRQFAFLWAGLTFVLSLFFRSFYFYSTMQLLLISLSAALLPLAVIFSGAFVLEKLADNYTPTNRKVFLLILNYASIPIFIPQILGFLEIISAFSLVILWYGFEAKVPVDPNKKIGFFILSAIVLFLLQTIFQAIFSGIFGSTVSRVVF